MTNSNSSQSQSSLASDGRDHQRAVRDEAGLVSTAPIAQRAVLVGVELQNQPTLLTLEDSLDELALLAKTAGVRAIARITQRLESPNPATLIGSGKVEELRMAVTELDANVVIFDDELSPRQQRELEKELGEEVNVVDRTALILDIFARHARTHEGAVQVELAQYEYRLPRLTRAWTHLARQAGGRAGGASGGVGVRGPGETQLEVDRREINRRIAFLKQQLAEISQHREHYRNQRRQSALPVVAVVGYTNAGKSTLLNAIANADVVAEDQLFATLDPTTRRVKMPSDRLALFSDTVGFIQKLPTMLVAAFRSTLEEVNEADLLVHVVDISHANMEEQIAAVEEILDDLGASTKPVVVALNKIDRLDRTDPEDAHLLEQALSDNPNAVLISAANGTGLDRLMAAVDEALREQMMSIDALIPYKRGDLVAMLHENGLVEAETHTEHGTHVVGRLPIELVGRLAPYWTANQQSEET
ncbi:GTPase HflX [Caldilinea sp.]|uniref:GTPase HflX n=1 Tax=Caldilinea sp. TaxID=2293560 RepID=UPI002C1F3B85|nr:GTPase HflX [Caldilinea sp.]HRA66051.1 GTPase HflX [Caldilinea sp.]